MAHLDVVGVDKSKWSVDPFAAVMKDGYLYGRGAIDDKGMLAANLAVFIALKRSQCTLNRDVIFLAEGDEEAGGETGMKFAVEKHWDKIAAGFALNEGGRTVVKNGKVQYVGVQVSEKVAVNVDVIATGTSGPRLDSAARTMPSRISPRRSQNWAPTKPRCSSIPSRAVISKVSLHFEDEETGKWMQALESPDRADHAARWLSNATRSGIRCCETPSRPRCCRPAFAQMWCPRKRAAS